jgi:hypothetical protein
MRTREIFKDALATIMVNTIRTHVDLNINYAILFIVLSFIFNLRRQLIIVKKRRLIIVIVVIIVIKMQLKLQIIITSFLIICFARKL